MKKLSLWVVLMAMFMLFLNLTVSATEEPAAVPEANEVVKYVLPAGKPFVILHRMMGPVPVISPSDSTITVLEVVTAEDGTEVVRFSLSYDKPTIKCPQHGADPYELYAPGLASDDALVRKDFLREVE